MWYEFFLFELKYRFRKPETYIFFLFVFLFSLAGVAFIFQGVDLGLVRKNSPLVIARSMAAMSGLAMVIVSMLMGVPVQRDYQYYTTPLIYASPISKSGYLWGHFLGSLVVMLLVFSGMLWGMMLGEYMPWSKPKELLPFSAISYLQPFIWVALPILLFGASVFFITGTLSKKPFVVYTQGIGMLALFMLSNSITNETAQAILDPFSLSALAKTTESWTVHQRNTLLIPVSGLMLLHRFFWLALSIAIFVYGFRRFRLKVLAEGKGSKKLQQEPPNMYTRISKTLPPVTPAYHLKAQLVQLLHSTWFHSLSMLKLRSFRAIVGCAFIILFVNSFSLGTAYGVDSYPTTYLIIEELQEMSVYFFSVLLLFYSAEIMWKERGAKFQLIHDATPLNAFVNVCSKWLALLLIDAIVIVSLIAAGILFQTIQGYYRYEPLVYLQGFFLEMFPFLALYTCVALFFQALTGNRFTGILLTLAFAIINMAVSAFGMQHVLLNFGGQPLPKYSAMNGYGHFLTPFLWVKAYWGLFGLLLLMAAAMLSAKGHETRLTKRWKAGQKQTGKLLKRATLICLLMWIATGVYIFYNTNVLNEYSTKPEEISFRAAYEKILKRFEYLPQPEITDVNLTIDLYPSGRTYEINGCYVLTNSSEAPIREIHVQKLIDSKVALTQLKFSRHATASHTYGKYHYTIYRLSSALAPGDTLTMRFRQTRTTKGFEADGFDTKVVGNGSFFDNDELPSLGYERQYELSDDEDRKAAGLRARKQKAGRNDVREVLRSRSGSDSRGIRLNVVISTEAPQTALTSGDLIKTWTKNGRNYYHYQSGQQIINFYPVLSASYEKMHRRHTLAGQPESGNVDMEIYYQKGHEYNLNRMMESMKMSLDYFSTHFSPYPYGQIRVVEIPGYRNFAQSLPGIIPFSETSGFIMNIDDSKDADMAFFITAHEVAHQWWGMQLEAANVQGQKMILETLAQYAALMVFKEKYPEARVQQFLKYQQEEYRKGRLKSKEAAVPLALVNNQNYIYYNLGALNMYELQKRIGEKNVNMALQKFMHDWRSVNNQARPGRYPTTLDLIQDFRKFTPDSLQHVITDLFEKTPDLPKQ